MSGNDPEDHFTDLHNKLEQHRDRALNGERAKIDQFRTRLQDHMIGDTYLPLIGGMAFHVVLAALDKKDFINAGLILNNFKPVIEKHCAGFSKSGLYFLYGRIAEASLNT